MKSNKAVGKIKRFLGHLSKRLGLPMPKFPKLVARTRKEKINRPSESFSSFAFRLLGGKTTRVLPLFDGLDSNLQHSGLKINFKAYVSLVVIGAFLTAIGALALVPILALIMFHTSITAALLFGVGGSLFAFAFVTIGFYVYPIYCADKLRRELEDELPFTTGYMAVLTSAGVSPEKIFHSLSNLSVPLAISDEAKDVMRDVNLFGRDIISALEEQSKRTPSEKLKEMIEGLISTIHSGSNLAAYLREKSKQYMKLKRISLKKFSDTLSILAEFYVTILITGPLLLVIMLAVMAMLPGGSMSGILNPSLILNLLTYIGIPLGSIMFLITLDAVSPKW
jgi:flagellar protein FlaJ